MRVFLREMGMQHVIYMETFESPECGDIYYRYAGPHHPDGPTGLLWYFGACPVHPRGEDNLQAAAQVIARLGEIELARQKQGA